MDYHKAINYLDSLQSINIKLGLERIRAACAAFGHPEKKFPSVIVAGTNGKGSTCAFLESILRHQGLKVGLYTSPHLTDVRERIQINRKVMPKRDFAALVERLCCHPRGSGDLECVKGIPAFAGMTKGLTYFEFLTLMAFFYFAEKNVDIAILEVGLGGRFDATNVATPLASVITRIGLDHEKYLGNTLEKIAFEKAGIVKEGVPIVTVDQETEAMRVIRDIAEEKHAMLHVVSPHEVRCKLGLLGEHQNENAALAIRAFDIVTPSLSLPPRGGGLGRGGNIVRTALSSTHWPGRLEVISKKPLVILDGAHNPNGAKALARFLMSLRANEVSEAIQRTQLRSRDCFARLRRTRNDRRIIAIFGAMEDKDIEGIVAPLIPVVDKWVITRPKLERAARTERIANIIRATPRLSRGSRESEEVLSSRQARRIKSRVFEFPEVETAIKRTLATMSKKDTLIITGSLYMVAEAKEYFVPVPF